MKLNQEPGTLIFSGLIVLSVLLASFNYINSLTPKDEKDIQFKLIQQYLVNNSSLAKSDKPILWLHNDYELNSRSWESFGSRNTNELNKPIIYLTVNSIIINNDKSFNICVIDDNSFNNLIPGWNIDLEKISTPNKEYYRNIAFLHLLYIYGGMTIPSSFLCFNNLIDIYNNFTKEDKFFVTECYPKSIFADDVISVPCMKIIGSKKNNNNILNLINIFENHFTNSFTDESNFKGIISRFLITSIDNKNCKLVSGKLFGYFDKDNSPILQSDLITEKPIEFHDKYVGVEIPIDEIIKRKHHSWFANIDIDNLPDVNNNIGYLLKKIYCSNNQ